MSEIVPDVPPPPPPVLVVLPPPVSGKGKWILFATPLVLLAGGVVASVAVLSALPKKPAAPYGSYAAGYSLQTDVSDAADGAALYAHYCTQCHGPNGDGNGTTALSPKARYFGYERFKFTDTQNPQTKGGATPTDDALVGILNRGIPGSPMPSFAHLGEDRLRAVVAHLRSQFLRPEVVMARAKAQLKAKVEKDQDEWEEKSNWSAKVQAEQRAKAVAELEVGAPLDLPDPFPEPTPESVARGLVAFEKLGCSKCHGKEGRGDGEQVKDPKFVNENGTRAYPRDLTAKVFRGGGEPTDLYRRVYLGIPGTPMPAAGGTASRQELIDVVQFVRNLPVP